MKMVVTFLPPAMTQSVRAFDSAMVISGSTRIASRSPEIRVAAVGDQRRRSSPGGRSSETATFAAATWTE
jgi:hypothetical protein